MDNFIESDAGGARSDFLLFWRQFLVTDVNNPELVFTAYPNSQAIFPLMPNVFIAVNRWNERHKNHFEIF